MWSILTYTVTAIAVCIAKRVFRNCIGVAEGRVSCLKEYAGKETMCWMESVAFMSSHGYYNSSYAIR